MGQSSFKWAIIDDDGKSTIIVSTLEDLQNLIDWADSNIVAIIRLDFA